MKRKAIVKVYNWQALVKLVIADLKERCGLGKVGNMHYIGGLDGKRNPFIRIDLTPFDVKHTPKFKG